MKLKKNRMKNLEKKKNNRIQKVLKKKRSRLQNLILISITTDANLKVLTQPKETTLCIYNDILELVQQIMQFTHLTTNMCRNILQAM